MKNKLCKFLIVIFYITISLSCLISGHNKEDLKIFIISDLHYFDPSLGSESELLQREESISIKMFKESQKILEETIEIILKEDADIILIPGDLTKDGEKKSNEIVSQYLSEIEKKGKRVFVIPGNHDINNSGSFSYSDIEGKMKTSNTSLEDFKAIYKDFGYEEALYKDSNSLSYIAALNEKTWLLSLAPIKSKKIMGEFTLPTLNWLKSKLIEAKNKNITIFAMIHQSILEHYPDISKIRYGRLIKDREKLVALLMDHNIKVIFTGHIHANDIEVYKNDKNFFIDISTGSIIIKPCSYRLVNYKEKNNVLFIETKNINFKYLDTDFQGYANEFINKQFPMEAKEYLIKMGLNDLSIDKILPLLVKTYIAFFHGNESINKDEDIMNSIYNLSMDDDKMHVFLAKTLSGIWNDKTPDRDVKINLIDGNIESLK